MPAEAAEEAVYQHEVTTNIVSASAAAQTVQRFLLFAPSGTEDHARPPATAASMPAEPVETLPATAEVTAEVALPEATMPPSLLLLQRAQAEAEQHLAAARAQAAAIHTQAYEEGFQGGTERGKQEAAEQYAPLLASFLQAIQAIACLREQVLRQAEEDIITLAFRLAQKIIRHEVRSPRDILAPTLRQALAYMAEQEQVCVRVHPEDLELARSLQEDFQTTIAGQPRLTLEGDATIGRGGCVVSSVCGEIDARLEAQFAELEQRFREQCLST
jgi:flagellar assembly protein FliH